MYYKLNNITSKEMCDIIEAALIRSEIDNFINPIGFDMFLELYMYEIFYPDKKAELEKDMAQGVFDAYDKLIKQGEIDKMHEQFASDINIIYKYADKWFEKQSSYNSSSASILSQFADILNQKADGLTSQLTKALQDDKLNEVFSIANKWGMDTSSRY